MRSVRKDETIPIGDGHRIMRFGYAKEILGCSTIEAFGFDKYNHEKC